MLTQGEVTCWQKDAAGLPRSQNFHERCLQLSSWSTWSCPSGTALHGLTCVGPSNALIEPQPLSRDEF